MNKIMTSTHQETPNKKDVAKLAGVSHMTVTRALRNYPHVRVLTRQKVLDACASLDYQPNIIAASLCTKKSYALGVVCPTLEHSFFARFINSVQETSAKLGYHIVVIQLKEGSSAWEQLRFLLQRQVDGLIIGVSLDREVSQRLSQQNIPIVLFAQFTRGFSFVGTDDLLGAKEAISYLIRLGHHRIAHLAGIPDSYTAKQRLRGYRRALVENGLVFQKELVFATDYDMKGGYQAALELLNQNGDFTAIFSANDYVAMGAMAALFEKGIKIPEEVSIIGFAGDAISQYTTPPLTTVYLPIEQIGQKVIELMMKQIQTPLKGPIKILLPNRLVKRGSCAQKERRTRQKKSILQRRGGVENDYG